MSIVLLLVFISCRKDEDSSGVANLDEFISKQEAGLFGYGGFLFKYTPLECQISINIKRQQIRLQNDSQTNWLHVHFSRFPKMEGESIELELRYRAGGDEIVNHTAMETVRAEKGKYWLWDSENNMGIIVPHCW